MAQKEATHREIVDELNDELSTVRRQHDDLLKLSRDQVRDALLTRGFHLY